ncbi:MAG TPA: hypothetical protein PLL54_04965, partial [Dermatophilaceae bacterium]|nr:hypothetical protein [Dermatophilaceae bacterium]
MRTSPVSVEVVEPQMADRVRRASDVYLLLGYAALAFVAISLGNLAVSTTGALEQELTAATSGLPRLFLSLFSWVAGVGVLILPIAVGLDLVIRRRPWQLIHALLGTGIAAGIALALKMAILDGQLSHVLAVLTRPVQSSGRTNPLDIVIVALTALVVVANINGRRWLVPLASLVLGSITLTSFLAGANTALALLCSFLLGAIVGHAVRYAFGTSATRAPGTDVARELLIAGTDLHTLVLVDDYDDGARLYHARSAGGSLDVHVFDRDTFGLAAGWRFLNRMRLRGASARGPALTLRAAVEHRALQAYALRWAGVTAPYPVAIVDVEGVSAAIAMTRVEGRTLREISAGLTDDEARAVIRLVATLQRHRIAFRGLSRDTVAILPDGSAGLLTTGDGDVASDDIARRTDAARLMVMLALGLGPARAVEVAVEEAGPKFVTRTLP